MKNSFTESLAAIRQYIVDFLWIPAMFAAGVVLRISGFTNASIWHDEMFSLQMTRQGLWEMIQSLKINISPPGFEVLLWFFTRVFGWNALGIRLPSVIAGILSLWLVYKLALRLQFTRGQQIASLAIISLLPYQLITAQQARVYAIFTLLYLVGLYAAISRQWKWLGVSVFGLLWCHHISFFFIPGLILVAMQVYPRDWRKILVAGSIGAFFYLPWIGITFTQSMQPMPWFTPLTAVSFLYSFYIAFFGWGMHFGNLGILISILFLCIFAALQPLVTLSARTLNMIFTSLFTHAKILEAGFYAQSNLQIDRMTDISFIRYLLLLAFCIPLAGLTAASLLIRNILMYRTIHPLTIPIVMWLVHYYVPKRAAINHWLVWVVSVSIIAIGVITWSPTQIGGQGIENLSNIIKNANPDDFVFLHSAGYSFEVFHYYFPDVQNYLIDGENVMGVGDLQTTKTSFKQSSPENLPVRKVWVVWARHPELEIFNRAANERTKNIIAKYKCPLISVIPYPNSWDVEIYKCNINK